jgi:hypothetical protein
MVVMSPEQGVVKAGPSREQMLYARILDWGMKAGLAFLIAGFAAYVAGALPLQVPLEELPRLWTLSAGDYLRESGTAGGWSPGAMFDRGDGLALAGVVFLASVSIPCLLVLGFSYAACSDWSYLAISAALAGVLVLAASGALVAH